MTSIPDIDIILTYILNGLFALVIFLFLIRPIYKTLVKSVEKLSGDNTKIPQTNIKKPSFDKKDANKQKLEDIKKKNAEIYEQAEKEVEQMENEIIAKLFEGKK
jgi:F0F1-type ATP synthase membrane subunit b/b'